jgi:hypothetical protein
MKIYRTAQEKTKPRMLSEHDVARTTTDPKMLIRFVDRIMSGEEYSPALIAAVRNVNMPLEGFRKMFSRELSGTLLEEKYNYFLAAVENPSCPPAVLKYVYKKYSSLRSLALSVVNNQNCPPEVIEDAVKANYGSVFVAALKHHNLPLKEKILIRCRRGDLDENDPSVKRMLELL